ncbi:MAG: RtcB family protein [bacterium]
MTELPRLEKIDRWRWRVPLDKPSGMHVEGRIYSSADLIDSVRNDPSLQQVANVATLPGIVGASLAMPDIHWGYGFPIGGVAAFDIDEGIISPGGVGYDINCGINLTRTRLTLEEIQPHLETLANMLFTGVPCGVGIGGDIRLGVKGIRDVAAKGARWAVKQGYADVLDLENMEEGGCLDSADPGAVSDEACERGADQIGTLGSGNHFLEVQVVDEVFDPDAAQTLGLALGHVCVMVHSGSRGFGYQVCQEQLKKMGRAPAKYGIPLVDRQLACAPVNSPEGRTYASAMAAAANMAWTNRIVLVGRVRRIFEAVFGEPWRSLGMNLVFDVSHNIAKFETHTVGGHERRLVVHRKGATRSFGPGDPRIPSSYRTIGQPVLIPGDMVTGSYVLVGTKKAMEETFGSTCHGAGRLLSRSAALRATKGRDLFREMRERGVIVRSRSKRTLGEEVPEAYKNIDAVVEAAEGAGIARRVVRLKPLAVIKG